MSDIRSRIEKKARKAIVQYAFLRWENAVIIGLVNANSPMTWDGTMLGALKVYARHGQATIIAPFVLAGAMSPVTVAGASAQIVR